MVALAGTELEFIAFNTSYEDAHRQRYHDLEPVNQYNVDYSILGTTRIEPLLRDIRNHMYAAGMDVEGAKGECNFGQHEIGFLYADALVTADNHSVYKTSAKEIAAMARASRITFMAKYNEREGNSCHIHLSLRGQQRRCRLLGRRPPHRALRPLRRRECWPRCATSRCSTRRTSTPTSGSQPAPSPRPRSPGVSTTAPAPCAWSARARAPGWRTGCRAATSTRTWRWPRCWPVGCTASSRSCPLEDELVGNAYASGRAQVPHTLREARDAFAGSAIARSAFGDEVVDHYTNMADVELAAFDSAVTDWELFRSFERM